MSGSSSCIASENAAQRFGGFEGIPGPEEGKAVGWGKLGLRERIVKAGGEIPEGDVGKGVGWGKSRNGRTWTFGRPLYLHFG